MAGERTIEILFVDDNEAHARILREALAGSDVAHHRVRVATNGREALDRLAESAAHAALLRPDLVLLDLDLPVVTGLDVLAEMKASGDLSAIPVVVMARTSRPEEIAACYGRGANSVVAWPSSLEEISEMLRAVVRYWTRVNEPPPAAASAAYDA